MSIERALSFVLAGLLLLASALTWAASGATERSWSQTIEVPGGQSKAVTGGVLGTPNVMVFGTFAVGSCCGSSTNDIKFSISEVDFTKSQDYGLVSGTFSFEWETGQDKRYILSFDNRWLACNPEGICSPDPSSPSYHAKTIEISVREVATTSEFDYLTPWTYVAYGTIAIGLVISLGFLRRRMKMKGKND